MASHRLLFNDIAGLAAAHAALDPKRQYWRSDILISSIIEILSRGTPLAERELRTQVRDLWHTNAVDRAMLRDALIRAEKAGLVERRENQGSTRWTTTADSAQDAKDDKEVATAILERFEQHVQKRLPDLLHNSEEITADRSRQLAHCLLTAFLTASQRVFDGVIRTAAPRKLDAIDFDHTVVADHLRHHVRPARLVPAMIDLANDAFDPTNDFGTEILHLIVTGRVLQGMVARDDLRGPSPVSDSLLLLDTSVLVYRLGTAGNPQPELLEEALQASQEAGCDIVVTRAVLDEWARLWRAAEREAQTLANSATGLPPRSWRLPGNPVLRSWLSASETGRSRTWAEFQRRYSQIETWLTGRGVRIIEDGEADPELVEQMRLQFVELSNAAAKPLRTAATAQTDAVSAAIVGLARQQRPAPVPRSWFIAQDQLTNKAYAAIRPNDIFPIASTVEAWLLLLSATRPHDPDEVCNLAGIVSESVVFNGFLSVIAGFGIENLGEMLKLLTQESSEDPEELAEQLSTDFLSQASSDSADVAATLLRHRAMRRERRLKSQRAELAAAEQKLAAQEDERKRRSTADQLVQQKLSQWKRGFGLLACLALIGLGIVVSAFAGASIWVVAGAAVGWAAIGCEGTRYVMTPAAKAWYFILTVSATILWTVLGSVLGVGLAQSATARPAPTVRPTAASVSVTGRPDPGQNLAVRGRTAA